MDLTAIPRVLLSFELGLIFAGTNVPLNKVISRSSESRGQCKKIQRANLRAGRNPLLEYLATIDLNLQLNTP